MKSLIRNISNKNIKIGVIGLGYVGLPRCIQFIKSNFKVIGFDNDKNKIKYIKQKKSYLSNLSDSILKKNSKGFFVTNNYKFIEDVDVIIICLPTPIKKNLNPDLSIVKKSLNKIKKYLRPNQAICFESTTYPGTTEELILPILKNKFEVGKNFFLIYSPERDDPGSKIDNKKIPKIISGYTNNCLKIGDIIYSNIVKKIVKVSSIKVAEMTKLYENIFRAINISLVNETKIILKKMKIDISEVIKAASTKPFGFMPFFPGPGYGGHCIPVDPYYFIWLAKRYGIKSKFVELSGNINRSIPNWIIKQIELELKKRNKSLNKSKVLIFGLAYKKNINDDRESPAYSVIKKLIKTHDCKVSFYDPYIKFKDLKLKNFQNKSITFSKNNLKKYDFAIIITDHSRLDYNKIKKNIKIIFDTKNIVKLKGNNIIKI